MLNVVIFLVCRNRATHLISSLNNISRLSRRNVFVRQACRMNHCVSVERPRDLSGGSALCLDSIPPRFIPRTMLQQSRTNLSWNFKLQALIKANPASQKNKKTKTCFPRRFSIAATRPSYWPLNLRHTEAILILRSIISLSHFKTFLTSPLHLHSSLLSPPPHPLLSSYLPFSLSLSFSPPVSPPRQPWPSWMHHFFQEISFCTDLCASWLPAISTQWTHQSILVLGWPWFYCLLQPSVILFISLP